MASPTAPAPTLDLGEESSLEGHSAHFVSDHDYLGPSFRPAYGGCYCCVVGCNNSSYNNKNGKVKLHRFPANPTRRDQWEKAVKRSVPGKKFVLWRASKTAVICSEHFALGKKTDEEGSPGFIPSLFPTHGSKLQSDDQKRRCQRLDKLQRIRKDNFDKQSQQVEHDKAPDEPMQQSEQQMEEEEEERITEQMNWDREQNSDCNNNDIEYDELPYLKEVQDCLLNSEDEEDDILNNDEAESNRSICDRFFMDYGVQASLPPISIKTTMKLKAFYVGFVECDTEKSTQVESAVASTPRTKVKQVQTEKQQVLPFENFTNRQFRAFTGVDKNFIEFLSYRVHTQLQSSRNLSKELKITMLMVKLKVNPTFAVLAAMFGLCEDTAIKYYYEALDIVAEESRKNIIWFEKSTVKARMPKSFKEHFENARAIIDCTEIETEIPSDVRENVLSYSHYKSKHTLKVLIAICPSGEITFMSKAFGGRCSDTEITVGSGFLNLVEPGDVILADKGFPSIQTNISEAGGILVMPPFKKGNRQFSEVQNQAGYQCSSVRIHVERAIMRLKRFECLTFVSASCRKNIDKMLQIIAFTVNCYTDLTNDDK